MFSQGSKFRSNRTFPELAIGCQSEGWIGSSTLIHSSKLSHEKILTSSSSSGILQIDFCNAFSSIKVNEMLKAVASSIPGFAAFTNFCYSQQGHFFYDKFVVSCESGIQQGDPLSPLLFSLTLWPIIEKIQECLPELQQHSWFLVDGVSVGSKDNLIRSWDLLCQLGPDRGLHVRFNKCDMWSPIDLDRLDIRIKRNDISGLEVLGDALGSPEFVCMKLNERIGKIRLLFEKFV